MKCITIRDLPSVPILDGYQWEFVSESAILYLSNEAKGLHLEIALMDYGIPVFEQTSDRSQWCHEWLVDYLRDVVGRHNTSNLAEIDSFTWLGWQAVTSLGNEGFSGTRCIASKRMPAAARISFPLRRNPLVPELVEILENISFEEKPAAVHTP